VADYADCSVGCAGPYLRGMAVWRSILLLSLGSLLGACGPISASFPDPADWGGLSGPGGPSQVFDSGSLWQTCAFLDGGAEDLDRHGSVTMYDGYLLMPWTPEEGGGGISAFAFSDPCNPEKVGEGTDPGIRETHGISLVRRDERVYAAFAYHGGTAGDSVVGGVQIWDVTDLRAPARVGQVLLPGYDYPDAVSRVTIATAWLGELLYVAAGDNGLYIVDTADPSSPTLVNQYEFESTLRVGRVHVLGNLAMISSLEGARTLLMDLSVAAEPSLLPGSEVAVSDSAGVERDYYFAEWVGNTALFARKESGGGFIAYRFAADARLAFAGEAYNSGGFGGHVRRQGDRVVVGDSDYAGVYDITNLAAPVEIGRAELPGDLDTATPIGNVLVLSVDKDAVQDQASAVVPFLGPLDRQGPRVELTSPSDGAILQLPRSSIGVAFDEEVEFKSVFPGSFRVFSEEGRAVTGTFSLQGALVSFSPAEPLAEDTTYQVSIPAGGVVDLSGNPTTEDYRFTFSTGEEVIGAW